MQVDFLMVVDAGVKELFPPYILQHVPQVVFEQQVLSAHDRAFEEQRFAPMLWDTLFERIEDKQQKTRIYNAMEAARKEAATVTGEGNPVEDFVKAWVACSLREVQSQCGNLPLDQALPSDLCRDIFHALFEAGALPLPLTQEGQPPDGLIMIDQAIEDGYAGTLPVPPAPEKPKSTGKSKASPGNAYRAPSSNVYKEPRVAPSVAYGNSYQGQGGQGQGGQGGQGKGARAKGFPAKAPGPKGGTFNTFGQKRPLEQSFAPSGGGKANGGKFGAAKWQKTQQLPNLACGNTLCTQMEDCLGDTNSALVQHLDNNVPGDIYCTACWAVFADADESLDAIPYEG